MAGRSRRRGGVLRPALRSARALAKPLLEGVPPGARMTIIGRGFVDFGRRRAMVAYGRET
jgi:hypothetical protein